MWVFCGLGNPGNKYERTRHNFGFMVVSSFAEKHSLRFKYEKLYPAEVAEFPGKCLLFKPMTYMNLSGMAVKKLVHKQGIKPEELLVIFDDMDLPLGKLKILPKGGAGGHNGVKSIISELGVDTFPRLKLGIGRPPSGIDPKEYVLSPFTSEEASIVKQVVDLAINALDDLLQEDLLKVMTKYNSLK